MLPPATVARLPRYLRFLGGRNAGRTVVSSEDIAAGSGVSAVQVRKDLSYLGTVGTRGVGYDVGTLSDRISHALGLVDRLGVAIVGAGNLGSALANYQGFEARGFRVASIYDVDPSRIGAAIDGLHVRHLDDLVEDVGPLRISIGIVATPGEAAQSVADRMIHAGIRSVLNFAPVVVATPAGVTVRQVDLATELQILSYHLSLTTPT
jgi:redox-sensing transcriptional repressor